jgi:DNA modification methylase
MTLELNKLYNGDNLDILPFLDSSSIDLAVIDPPYFRIVNHKWDKFGDVSQYREYTEKYITELKRVIRLNGTLLLFGCSRNFNIMGDINTILEENDFEFVQEIVIDKGMKSVAGRISNKIKMLPPVSENVIVYRKNGKPFVKELLLSKQKEFGYTTIEIKKVLGMSLKGGGNWTKYVGNTEFPLFPTRNFWEKISNLFDIDISYDKIKETYNGKMGLTNVWNDINFYMKPRIHPTQKPLDLITRCIEIFSDENDTVLDIFSGSGTTAVSCINTNRNWIAIERDVDYFTKSTERILELSK